MLLAIDIGNTNINLATMGENGGVVGKYSVPTGSAGLGAVIKKVAKTKNIDRVLAVSVVPKALKGILPVLTGNFGKKRVFVVGKDIRVPLRCEYNKRQIGQDRLVTAFAAKSIYGLPILIVDFGTAVTFDVVSKKGVYLGGLILPGVKMSLESLYERTAMLPRTYLKRTGSFIGRDTASSIRNGMIYGYGAMCDGLITLFRDKIGKDLKIVATGGDAPLISRFSRSVKTLDPDLSFKGLYLISKLV